MTTASVVVCAYTMDRWEQVSAALRSAAEQDVVPVEILLVVDHNDELLRRARAELEPRVTGLRVVDNTRTKGLSGARNVALAQCVGDVVVFLDDDARADGPGWLGLLMEPFRDARVLGVGGSASPLWPDGRTRPVTLPPGVDGRRGVLDWVVGCTFDGQPAERRPIRNLMGCNMALRRTEALAAGGFAETLGRVGKTPLGCEETELCIRLTSANPDATMVFEPAARVLHNVSPDRLTWAYLRRRSYAEGISKAAVSRMVGSGPGLSSERTYVARVLPRAAARGALGAVVPGTRSRAEHVGHLVAVLASLTFTVGGYVRGLAGLRGGLRSTRAPLASRDPIPPSQT